jgi:alanyl-tRNA synthetase
MLVDALVEVSDEKEVYVRGYSEKFSKRLTIELKRYAQTLNLDLNLIQDKPSENTLIFNDHFKLYD